jgi:hypothetical protein
MVVVGADVHKRSHTFVAVDEAGRKLGQLTVKADAKGHDEAVRWAEQTYGADLKWGIEDCRHLSARLEMDLLDAGQRVVRVPPKMMAEQRRTARTHGKSDPIDALADAMCLTWPLPATTAAPSPPWIRGNPGSQLHFAPRPAPREGWLQLAVQRNSPISGRSISRRDESTAKAATAIAS